MKRIFLGFALLLTSFASLAATDTLVCSTCGDFKAKAKAAGAGIHYVVNPLSGEVRKYNVVFIVRRGLVPREMPVEQAVTNFAKFAVAKRNSPVRLVDTNALPGNAYELVEYPQLQATVGNYLKEHGIGYFQDMLTYIGAMGSIVGFDIKSLDLTIRVHMPDGSSALFIYNHTTQTWEMVQNSARDSSNNIVPETIEDVSSGPGHTMIYQFNNVQDLASFLDRMQMLGVRITGPVGSNPGRPMVCVTDPETKVTTCSPG